MADPLPTLAAGGLRIVALGGLGEIGRNMTVFECDGQLLIVDCGVLFPEESQPGVDLILPDFDYLRGRLDDIVGLVLTHGHEDHIGAVPFLLRERSDLPIYGSRLTLALLEAKLREHRQKPPLNVVAEGDTHWLGAFRVGFVAVNHSIPDALGVVIDTTAGRVVAVFLMIGGISLVGLVTATLASWVIEKVSDGDAANTAVTAAQIDQLRLDMQQRIDALTVELQRLNGAAGSPATRSGDATPPR